jgi:mRNA-capping enzyme
MEDIPLAVLDAENDDGYLETLDGAIVEAAFDEASAAWKPLRIRTDKETPNPYAVFKSVYDSIKDNVTFEELMDKFRYLD